jgi:hypothetical protein
MSRREPDIEVHIEELVWHGAAPGGSSAIAAELAASLESALAAHGLGRWADGAAVDHIAAPRAAAQPVGEAIATGLRGPRP